MDPLRPNHPNRPMILTRHPRRAAISTSPAISGACSSRSKITRTDSCLESIYAFSSSTSLCFASSAASTSRSRFRSPALPPRRFPPGSPHPPHTAAAPNHRHPHRLLPKLLHGREQPLILVPLPVQHPPNLRPHPLDAPPAKLLIQKVRRRLQLPWRQIAVDGLIQHQHPVPYLPAALRHHNGQHRHFARREKCTCSSVSPPVAAASATLPRLKTVASTCDVRSSIACVPETPAKLEYDLRLNLRPRRSL